MKVFLVFLVTIAIGTAGPVTHEDSVLRLVANQFVNCVNSDLSLCLKENALKVTERLGTVRKLTLIDGVTILNNNPKEARSLDTLPTDPEARNKQVTEKLWENASDLLKQGELELSYAGGDGEESRAIDDTEEGRGKKKEGKKKLKLLIPLLLLAKAKAIALIVLSLLVIAGSIYKIAVMAKIAFIVKAITFLKHLLHKKHEEEHGGWAPVEEHSHGGWDGGWSRSKNDAGNLAYSHYRK
ncbi:uncharacterized protein LOC106130709 [Amyelois transitella]|uniref:uncharacterized protein LOC106130709 n=1 Tax=Amyelois transitella TaxID=680683 RepID=UPI00067E5EAA|nr:uncharacterized protein LOC106130709 [Amyelois transitella]